jgi:hypothetical protein
MAFSSASSAFDALLIKEVEMNRLAEFLMFFENVLAEQHSQYDASGPWTIRLKLVPDSTSMRWVDELRRKLLLIAPGRIVVYEPAPYEVVVSGWHEPQALASELRRSWRPRRAAHGRGGTSTGHRPI